MMDATTLPTRKAGPMETQERKQPYQEKVEYKEDIQSHKERAPSVENWYQQKDWRENDDSTPYESEVEGISKGMCNTI